MKEKYSKNSAKKMVVIRNILLVVLTFVLITGILLLYIGVKNVHVVVNANDDAKNVSDDVAKKSTPIIVNNLLLGASDNNTWVSSERFYFKSENKDNKDNKKIDMYTLSGKKGTYEIDKVVKATDSSAVFISNTSQNKTDEYVAVSNSKNNIMPLPAKEHENITDEEKEKVKSVFGMFKLLNSSINITKAYDIQIDSSNKGVIYEASNVSGKLLGGYSAIVYIRDNGEAYLVKYNYIANFKNSADWATYSFKFVADLNQDGKNEIIIQEIKEEHVLYDAFEFNNKFVQILSAEMNIKLR